MDTKHRNSSWQLYHLVILVPWRAQSQVPVKIKGYQLNIYLLENSFSKSATADDFDPIYCRCASREALSYQASFSIFKTSLLGVLFKGKHYPRFQGVRGGGGGGAGGGAA